LQLIFVIMMHIMCTTFLCTKFQGIWKRVYVFWQPLNLDKKKETRQSLKVHIAETPGII